MQTILQTTSKLILPKQNIPQKTLAVTNPIHQKILQNLEIVPHDIREENIFTINSHQENIIRTRYWVSIEPSTHEESRKLISYFRPTQITPQAQAEIIEIMHFLKSYVEGGYSQIFNEFWVVYRFPDKDKQQSFIDNSYLVSGDEFKLITSIFADTIHFSDGTPENIEWTTRILWTTPYKRNKWKFDNIVHFEREYEILPKITWRWWLHQTEKAQKQIENLKQPRQFISILTTMLHTLQRTERTLLDNSQK